MKRLLLIITWLLTTSFTLFTTITFYQFSSRTQGANSLATHQLNSIANNNNALTAYAALPQTLTQTRTAILGADARPVTIDAYFETYNSPLHGLGQLIVSTADKHSVDPYLIVAIAQQESNLCKLIPDDSHNCWGWGIHSEGTLKFPSYEIAIQKYTQGLKKDYLDKGYDTPEKIMKKYTPLSNGSWARGVNQFLDELNSGNF